MAQTKKTKTAPKAKTIKFFTVVGNSRIGGCIENSNYEQVFKTRREAAKFIADEVNNFIDQEELEDRLKETAESCMYGTCFYIDNDEDDEDDRLDFDSDEDDRLDFDIVEHTVPADFFKG